MEQPRREVALKPKNSRAWSIADPEISCIWDSFVEKVEAHPATKKLKLDSRRLVSPSGSLDSAMFILLHYPSNCTKGPTLHGSIDDMTNPTIRWVSEMMGGLNDVLLCNSVPMRMGY